MKNEIYKINEILIKQYGNPDFEKIFFNYKFLARLSKENYINLDVTVYTVLFLLLFYSFYRSYNQGYHFVDFY